ncbi:MAG: GNAT family N-acetyltransferase [Candidatus Loosdrechtia sp.]|uniref:GNAT family N-acetyltransferase n=1 Tax=Candidatus Loosdrechtia sp. TaxID=3101272 RepID=UPI003A78BA6F|nr:MAG: GNAT family N-acetyltransferase [Candidatus Jettenia sp. AMX2]
MKILEKDNDMFLVRLTSKNIHEVARIYQENPKFFKLLTGTEEIPLAYIEGEIEGIPQDFNKENKFFMGIFLKISNMMIGVADFLVSYPVYGKGCFGLLLLSEQFQSQGYGKKAVQLVEKWAYECYAVREITLGVELINKKAYAFWTKCGYVPTGEIFENTAMRQTHKTELFKKILKDV